MEKEDKNTIKSFVLHDESVNTSGFRMLTSGVDLSEFEKNPVMFYCHKDWEFPVGRWENIRIEGTLILADPVFDEGDEEALKIKGKVERGFLKAASIGAWPPIATSTDPTLMLPGQELPTVTRWKAREASICPIGRNHNALRLYDIHGKEIDLTDPTKLIKLFDSATDNKTNMFNSNNNNMNELARLLNLSDSASSSAIAEEVKRIIALKDTSEAKVRTLEAESSTLKTKLQTYETKEKETQRIESIALTDAAIKDGRIDASGKEIWLGDFEKDFEGAKLRLSSIPKRVTLADKIQTGTSGSAAIQLSDMSFQEIVKADRLRELKADKGLYQQKFYEAYGRNPS